jgi:hypothetical protein
MWPRNGYRASRAWWGNERIRLQRDIKTVKLGCTLDGAPECSWRMIWS